MLRKTEMRKNSWDSNKRRRLQYFVFVWILRFQHSVGSTATIPGTKTPKTRLSFGSQHTISIIFHFVYYSHDPHLNAPFWYYTHIITYETHREKQRITYELFAGIGLGSLPRGFLWWVWTSLLGDRY